MRVSDKYVFFWRGFIGNWFKSPIIEVIDEYPYHFLNVEQYFMYMNNLVHGDLGESMIFKGRGVTDTITTSFPASAKVGLLI